MAQRTITTIEELRSLPDETVILESPDSNTYVSQKHGGEWYVTSDASAPSRDEDIELPARVLWTPGD